ncbi:MAG: hypothetical protein KI786_17010 [Mameliella sp.]|nr:hypothetical protein [Phaeodactylibacter sp.]NRA49896.1 hypothetical protein [Phaeodactylibacter sp.]
MLPIQLTRYLDGIDRTLGLTEPKAVLKLFLKMTLVLLLLHMTETVYLKVFMPILVVPGIFIDKLLSNKYYWLFLTLVVSYVYLYLDLTIYVPNHKHMYAYVLIAISASFFLADNKNLLATLREQSRIIIGLCFMFATIGKFLAPEFLNTTFFEFTGSTDGRFFGILSVLGLDKAELLANQSAFKSVLNSNLPGSTIDLYMGSNMGMIALFLTVWTIFVEGMIAITFLLPKKYALSKYRNFFLAAFIVTTYPIATVAGFGIVLLLLGFLQSMDDGKVSMFTRFYFLVFIALPIINAPFADIYRQLML